MPRCILCNEHYFKLAPDRICENCFEIVQNVENLPCIKPRQSTDLRCADCQEADICDGYFLEGKEDEKYAAL